MEYQKIMKEIAAGMSGDQEQDLKYLREQMEKYKGHPLAKEIIRACGRMLFELMSEEQKAELNRLINVDEKSVQMTLEEVRFKVYQKKFDEALQLMEPLAQQAEEMEASGMYANDSVSDYYRFREFFEEALFRELCHPEKQIRQAQFPYEEIYLQYGSLLMDLKRYDEANRAMEKARRWNPCNAKIAFEYIETLKMLGDLEQFFEQSKAVFRIAFRPDDVARCYRNLGYYFAEKRLWSEAMACNIMSLQFDRENKSAQSELYYIQQKSGGKVKQPSMKDLEKYSKTYGFSLGADADVLGLAYAYGQHAIQHGDSNGAKYFLEIVYALTDDAEIGKMLDDLNG